MRAPLVLLAAAGCAPVGEPAGCFAGSARVFVVDQVLLPGSAAEFADDLDGDGRPDDRLRSLLGAVEALGMLPDEAASRMLSTGALSPVVELISEDDALRDDACAGALWTGRRLDPSTPLSGALSGGDFSSRRARDAASPATGTVYLPILPRARPLALPLVGLELEMAADPVGVRGAVHGAVTRADLDARVVPDLHQAVLEQLAADDCLETRMLAAILDENADGVVTLTELRSNPMVRALLAPDVQLFDADGRWRPSPSGRAPDALSIGFGFHAFASW